MIFLMKWLPALLWILVGTVFMGAVHDLGALVLSVKEQGRSIADITSSVISKRVRLMFLIFVLLLVWLVLAVFAMAIADLFVSVPTSVIPVNIQIIIALIMGILLNKKNINGLFLSLCSVALLYFFVWVGSNNPIILFTYNFLVLDGRLKHIKLFRTNLVEYLPKTISLGFRQGSILCPSIFSILYCIYL